MTISQRLLQASLVVGLLGAVPAHAADEARPDKVSFYFAAHADDWQLFMNPSAFKDVIESASKTVFIHLTAGDAGLGVGKGGRRFPLFLARENGAEQAIRFMADTDNTPVEKIAEPLSFNGHDIHRVAYRNTVSYFLRVPDGHWSGEGYYETGYQSLQRLNTGENSVLRAIDGSATYHGWNDLVKTLRAIMDHERGGLGQVQINIAELDTRINPQDHSDHWMAAKAALDAVKDLSCVRRVSYVDYASSKLRANLSARERDMESSVFAVTLAGVQALDHPTSWNHYEKSFVGRNYFRVQEGNGRCAPPRTTVAGMP